MREDLFGGAFGYNIGLETGAVIFSDGLPAGSVNYVEWRTAAPVTIGSFIFFMHLKDMVTPLRPRRRALSVVGQIARPSSFDLVLYDFYYPSNPIMGGFLTVFAAFSNRFRS
jgi:hypothetical protein